MMREKSWFVKTVSMRVSSDSRFHECLILEQAFFSENYLCLFYVCLYSSWKSMTGIAEGEFLFHVSERCLFNAWRLNIFYQEECKVTKTNWWPRFEYWDSPRILIAHYRSFLIFSMTTWFIHSPAYHSCPDITCCLFVLEPLSDWDDCYASVEMNQLRSNFVYRNNLICNLCQGRKYFYVEIVSTLL